MDKTKTSPKTVVILGAIALFLILAFTKSAVALVLLGLLALIVGLVVVFPRKTRQKGAWALGIGFVMLVTGIAVAIPESPANDPDPVATAETSSPEDKSAPARTQEPSPTEEATVEEAGATEPASTRALDVLAVLAVKGRAAKTGYDRDAFAYRSYDADRNGCDTRNDILGRDMAEIEYRPGSNECTVNTGVLADPYSGSWIPFTRGSGTSSDVQIDHVVALSNAWQTGAQAWDSQTMREFGNDPLNLLAVSGPLNQQKGDGDAATWLPPNRSYRCAYVARQIAVKYEYELWVTQAEHDAMERVLERCPDEEIPTEGETPVVVTIADPMPSPEPSPTPTPTHRPTPTPTPTHRPSPTPTQAPEPEPEPDPVPAQQPDPEPYYQNCTEVRAAGAAPIFPGDPGWQPKFDRDKDGVGCES